MARFELGFIAKFKNSNRLRLMLKSFRKNDEVVIIETKPGVTVGQVQELAEFLSPLCKAAVILPPNFKLIPEEERMKYMKELMKK
jgi:hypothetical protein